VKGKTGSTLEAIGIAAWESGMRLGIVVLPIGATDMQIPVDGMHVATMKQEPSPIYSSIYEARAIAYIVRLKGKVYLHSIGIF
jgi:hypothetical protein